MYKMIMLFQEKQTFIDFYETYFLQLILFRYDVDRGNQESDSEVQVIDGFFVHYFVPQNLTPLSKHVIFVLDVRYVIRVIVYYSLNLFCWCQKKRVLPSNQTPTEKLKLNLDPFRMDFFN